MTPTLILMGIPPAVAVGTQSAQILASSVSGVLANSAAGRSTSRWATCWWRWLLGSGAGVGLFNLLMRLGQIDIFVSLAYVLFLGTVGAIMFAESLGTILRSRRPARAAPACTGIIGARLAAEDALPRLAALHQVLRRC